MQAAPSSGVSAWKGVCFCLCALAWIFMHGVIG